MSPSLIKHKITFSSIVVYKKHYVERLGKKNNKKPTKSKPQAKKILFSCCIGKRIKKKKSKNPNLNKLMSTVIINHYKTKRQVSEKVRKTFDNLESTTQQAHLHKYILPLSLSINIVQN